MVQSELKGVCCLDEEFQNWGFGVWCTFTALTVTEPNKLKIEKERSRERARARVSSQATMTKASTMSTGSGRPGSLPLHRRLQWTIGGKNERGGNLDLMRWLGSTLQRNWSTWRASLAPVGVEADCGGEDMWNAEAEREGNLPGHLVVMVNGLGGSPNDWKFAAEQIVERLPDKVIVHRSKCNTAKLTYDGVDRMGERLAEEVRSVIAQRRNLTKISFVAHSLGGLIARYAIGILYNAPSDPTSEGRIAGLEPMNFVTSATPHLGSRGHKQLPFLFGLSLLEKTAVETAHLMIGRTGKHLFLTDNDDGNNMPLLVRMVHDQNDLKFMSALRAFKQRVAYANANYDHIVGWRTSSFRRLHELPKQLTCSYSDKYPNIVNIDNGNQENCQGLESPVVNGTGDVFEEEMIRGLTQVHWERIDVRIQKSRLRYNAHNTIQVRSKLWNSDGADVIFHMIDNFLV
ncbi:hypothetical protein LUZ60_000758 [Juncus effusus]|nr:hypothetical protein LUZ60_000758 [Juncus effusus]